MAPKSAAKKRAAATAAVAKKATAVQEEDRVSKQSSTESMGLPPTISTITSKDHNGESTDNKSGIRDTSPTSSSAGSASISNSSSESLGSTGSETIDARSRASRKKNQKRRETAKRNKTASLTKPDAVALFENAIEQTIEDESTRSSLDNNGPDGEGSQAQADLTTAAELNVQKQTTVEESQPSTQLPSSSSPSFSSLPPTQQPQLDIVLDNISAVSATLGIINKASLPLDSDPQQEQDRSATIESRSDTVPKVHSSPPSYSLSKPTISDLLGLDNDMPIDNSTLPLKHTKQASLLDSNHEPGVAEQATIPGMEPQRKTASSVVYDYPPLETEAKVLPGFETETSSLVEIGTEIEEQPVTAMEPPNQVHSWKVACEHVITIAIQCLTETKDMEQSYISLLSAITVLNSRQEDSNGEDDTQADMDTGVHVGLGAYGPVGKLCAQLLGIMIQASVAGGLDKETLRQGVFSPVSLYIRLYMTIQNAGYHLQNEDHIGLGQFLFDRQNTEDALFCLNKIDTSRWTSHTYRLAISCHLFSKPRHLHEAEILFDQYLAHNKSQSATHGTTPPSSSSSKLSEFRRGSRSPRDQEGEQFNKNLIQTWFNQKLDASKWDEIKDQYERRRTRLLDAPRNIERLSASLLDRDSLSSQVGGGGASHASIAVDHGSVVSGSSESLAVGTTAAVASTTRIATEPPVSTAPTKRSSFSVFSVFSSSKTSTASPVPAIQTKSTHDMSSRQSPTPSASTIQVNRHLTILDNGMLEECVNHKQFEYGWSIYERMGSILEVKDTAKIAMRLCKRAFLGHGGLGPNFPGSPGALAKGVYFGDEDAVSQEGSTRSEAVAERRDEQDNTGATRSGSKRRPVQEDPEF
ncbi:hypothetical protein BGX33_003595 [Mortierella sp. NVP41]|nr:hypothetical protein BGX33_003595 [Mortierella sp. NVP41]